MKKDISRRKLLLTTSVITSGLLSGCLKNNDKKNKTDPNETTVPQKFRVLRGSEDNPVHPDYWSETEDYKETSLDNFQFALDYQPGTDDSLLIYLKAESPETNSKITVEDVKEKSGSIIINSNVTKGESDVSLSKRTELNVIVEVEVLLNEISEITYNFKDWYGEEGSIQLTV